MRPVITTACLALLASAAAAQQSGASPSAQNGAQRMTLSQITEHNAQLGPSDPAFIKCARMEGPGSFVKRKVCRTNEDWNKRADAAGQEARDIVDSVQLHGSSASQEPQGSIVPLGPN